LAAPACRGSLFVKKCERVRHTFARLGAEDGEQGGDDREIVMTQEQDRVAESVARAFRFAGPGAFGGVNALQRQMAVEADLGEELESLERASLFRAFEEAIESSRGSRASAEGASPPDHAGPQWRQALRRAAKQVAKDAKRPKGSRARTRSAKPGNSRRAAAEAPQSAAPS
jgi:hypothetical protein